MGLDMYLTAEVFVSEYYKDQEELFAYLKDNAPKGLKGFEPTCVTYEVGYWRKANAIHKWFVQNVQNGQDDCEDYGVSIDNLHKLKDICQRILEDKSLATELLPSASGFFFGSVEYDEYYFRDLERTLDIINKIFNNPDCEMWYIKYRSSW